MSKGAALTLDAGCALDVANCTITILVAVLVAIVVAASCPLPGVFVTVLVLCTLADALKARQTEYYTNTRLRRPSTVPCRPLTLSSTTTHSPLLPPILFAFVSLSLWLSSLRPCRGEETPSRDANVSSWEGQKEEAAGEREVYTSEGFRAGV